MKIGNHRDLDPSDCTLPYYLRKMSIQRWPWNRRQDIQRFFDRGLFRRSELVRINYVLFFSLQSKQDYKSGRRRHTGVSDLNLPVWAEQLLERRFVCAGAAIPPD